MNDLPSQPLPFTLRVPDDGINTVLNSGLYAVSGVPAGQSPASSPTRLRFEYSTAENGLHVVKEFEIPPDGYILTVKTTLTAATGELPYAIHWGAAVGDIVENSRYAKKAEGLLYQDKVRRLATERPRGAADSRGRLQVRRRRRQLLHDGGAVSRSVESDVPGDLDSAATGFEGGGARSGRLCDRAEPPRRADQVLRRAQGLRRAGGDRSRSGAGDRFRHVLDPGRAAAAFAEVGPRLRRQLRLVDHHPDHHHQRDHVSAAAQERGVDAEDAGDPARGEGDPGSLLEAEGDRSGQAEDESRK